MEKHGGKYRGFFQVNVVEVVERVLVCNTKGGEG